MKKLLTVLLSLVIMATCGVMFACKDSGNDGDTPPAAKEVSVLSGWENGNDEGNYTVTTVNGKTQIAYNKNKEWSNAARVVDGETLEGMKTLEFTVKVDVEVGTSVALMKIIDTADAHREATFMMSKAYTTFQWDLSDYEHLTQAIRIDIYMNPGTEGGQGNILIKEMKFTDQEADPDLAPKLPAFTAPTAHVNVYESGDTFAIKNFSDNGDNVYNIVNNDDGSAIVSYNKWNSLGAYSAFRTNVKGAGLAGMKTFEMQVQGIKGTELIVKPYDRMEKRVTLTGGVDLIQVDLRSLKDLTLADGMGMIFMAEPGKTGVIGKFEIKSARFTKEDMPIVFEWFDKFDVLSGMIDDPATAKQMMGVLVLNEKDLANLVVTAKGAVGDKLSFNLYNLGETAGTPVEVTLATDKAETHIVDVSGFTIDATKRVMFVAAYTGEAKPEITALYFTPNTVVQAGGNIIAANMFTNVSADQRFSFDYTGGAVTVTYDTNGWDSMVAYVDFGEGGFDTVTMKVTGANGSTAIINVGGKEVKFENDNKLDGTTQDVVFTNDQLGDIKALKGIQVIRIFLDWDPPAGQQFVIDQLSITKSA